MSANVEVAYDAKTWKQRNKLGALAFVDSGHSAEEVVQMLQVAYTHPSAQKFYSQVHQLTKLADYWPNLQRFASGHLERGRDDPMMPDPYENGGKSFMEITWQPGDPEEEIA